MKPENFTFGGFAMLALGFTLVTIGAFFFGEVYFCLVNSASCPLSAREATTRIGYSIPLLAVGSLLVIPGAVVMAAGHITEHLRPKVSEEESDEEISKQVLRVCLKCGRQVDPTAGYCPSCGNQLAKI